MPLKVLHFLYMRYKYRCGLCWLRGPPDVHRTLVVADAYYGARANGAQFGSKYKGVLLIQMSHNQATSMGSLIRAVGLTSQGQCGAVGVDRSLAS